MGKGVVPLQSFSFPVAHIMGFPITLNDLARNAGTGPLKLLKDRSLQNKTIPTKAILIMWVEKIAIMVHNYKWLKKIYKNVSWVMLAKGNGIDSEKLLLFSRLIRFKKTIISI